MIKNILYTILYIIVYIFIALLLVICYIEINSDTIKGIEVCVVQKDPSKIPSCVELVKR